MVLRYLNTIYALMRQKCKSEIEEVDVDGKRTLGCFQNQLVYRP